MTSAIPQGALYILRTLRSAGYEAFLVGGCVRDLVRGAVPRDWDLCTSALPEQTLACFAGERVLPTGLKHGTVTLVWEDGPYEITTYRADGPYSDGRRPDQVRFLSRLEEDLARRDFTVNAMAMGPDGTLRDPFGGAEDIRRRLIRCVGEGDRRFREDGLRVMRALRFSACLDYRIEAGTAAALRRCRVMLAGVSAERIREELCKLIVGPGAGAVLRGYPEIFAQFWPELGPLVTLEQNNPWHCWGGWEHTACAVEAVPPSPVPRLAALLHDVGKPGCKTTDEHGIDHFYGHGEAGAVLAEGMLRALRFDTATRKRVVELVRYHGVELTPGGPSVRRWLGRLGSEGFFQLLELKQADNLAQSPRLVEDRLAALADIRREAEEILARRECFCLRDLAVDGRDVLAAGIPAGPAVGRALDALLEGVLSGSLPNRRDVLLEQLRTGRLSCEKT